MKVNFPTIKASRSRVWMQMHEVFVVTEWRDGCVYRARSLGYIVCDVAYQDMLNAQRDIMVGSVSTRVMEYFYTR